MSLLGDENDYPSTKKVRRIAHRRCSGCGRRRPKTEMIRMFRDSGGVVAVQRETKQVGRGCYVCRNMECVSAARRRAAFGRALRTKVPGVVLDELEVLAADVQEREPD